MQITKPSAGITSYGVYVPRFRIDVEAIAKVWNEDGKKLSRGLNIVEKAVPDLDEDTITISVEAARNALARADIDPSHIDAVYVGSESHPYAVKPSAASVAEAVGAVPHCTCADLEFACKAGTAGMQMVLGMVNSGQIRFGLAIGADCAQARPGDPLEYAAGAGAAAILIGMDDKIAEIEGTHSFTTDTPDFFRREGRSYPSHGNRFTGEPAYFKHVMSASESLMEKLGMEAKDFDWAVFHQPNGKFPLNVSKKLGIPREKVEPSLAVRWIGNTYSGASMIGLACILDIAAPGDRILLTSYGSGAGSDAFSMIATEELVKRRQRAPLVSDYIKYKENIDYAIYAKHRSKLVVH
ncbi:MAG: hydroxymethylglutaryl-CoA synthase [Candidatus Hodarchaeota archaeon]